MCKRRDNNASVVACRDEEVMTRRIIQGHPSVLKLQCTGTVHGRFGRTLPASTFFFSRRVPEWR